MRLISHFVLIIALTVVSVFSQSASVLTNADIVEMTKMKLPAPVIISKIKTSSPNFAVAIPDLKVLTEAGVDDEVVSAMIERQASGKTPKKEITFSSENAEFGTLSEIRGRTKVFVATADAVARPIIVRELNKSRIFTIVDTREEADFGVIYGAGQVDVGSNVLLGTVNNMVVVGEMQVYTYLPVSEGDTKGRVRIVWQKRKTQDFSGGLTFDRNPARQLIDSFIKDFRKMK